MSAKFTVMGEVQKADRNALRATLLITGLGALLGVALITLAAARRAEFEVWLSQTPRTRVPMVLAALLSLTAGPLFGLAVYWWRLGKRIRRTARYPPPGVRVIRDTPILMGDAAKRRGRAAQGIGVALALAGVILALLLWSLSLTLCGTSTW